MPSAVKVIGKSFINFQQSDMLCALLTPQDEFRMENFQWKIVRTVRSCALYEKFKWKTVALRLLCASTMSSNKCWLIVFSCVSCDGAGLIDPWDASVLSMSNKVDACAQRSATKIQRRAGGRNSLVHSECYRCDSRTLGRQMWRYGSIKWNAKNSTYDPENLLHVVHSV